MAYSIYHVSQRTQNCIKTPDLLLKLISQYVVFHTLVSQNAGFVEVKKDLD